MEQKREPMNKNRIGGIRRRTSRHATAKSISIKGAGCKSGGCVLKAVELTSGDLSYVWDSGLGAEQSASIGRQKSAEGIVAALAAKARTVIESSRVWESGDFRPRCVDVCAEHVRQLGGGSPLDNLMEVKS